jgi:hypothetical protein
MPGCCSTFLGLTFLMGWGLMGTAAGPVRPLDELLQEYKALGLPLPGPNARLARYEEGGGLVNGNVRTHHYRLVFLVNPARKASPPSLFSGFGLWQPGSELHVREVKGDPDALQEVKLDPEDALILAVQCHSRGWDRLAQRLLERGPREDQDRWKKRLVRLAWDYWEGQLSLPKIDRGPIAKRLRALLRRHKELQTDYNQALVESLALALRPSKAKPGSIEALIDDLVDYTRNTGTFVPVRLDWDRYRRIARRGFEAVPALIDHLDDKRLTRARMVGFDNFPSWRLRVGDVVGDLLEGLAGEYLGRDRLRRQQGHGVNRAVAKKWWAGASRLGEEAYLIDHLLSAPEEGSRPWHAYPHQLSLLRLRYPRRIPTLYQKVLDKRPEQSSDALADAVLCGPMPRKEKLAIFLRAAGHKDYKHRLPAFEALAELDKKQFASLLLATLETLPRDVPGDYWNCPEVRIARLALKADDPRVWPLLKKVAKRSAVGLRMELLYQFNSTEDKRHLTQRLRLLASFLGDDALRNATFTEDGPAKKFIGPCAGFHYAKISVRDFVALEIASLLDMDVKLNPGRTPLEWAKIRTTVQAALKRKFDQPPQGVKDKP